MLRFHATTYTIYRRGCPTKVYSSPKHSKDTTNTTDPKQSVNISGFNETKAKTSDKTTTLCLTMIVKNEGKIIERLLNSLVGIIDTASILDTGSVDKTKEIMSTWFIKHNIPFKIHEKPFRNFGQSRTDSFKFAKRSFPNSTYFLLSDADFVWHATPGFNKSELNADCYLVTQQHTGVGHYANIRLLRNNQNWICKLPTHEFWTVSSGKPISSYVYSNLWIQDVDDGGSKTNKFARDANLLLDAIRNPKKHDIEKSSIAATRCMFYYAQTLACMGNHKEAIRFYKERTEINPSEVSEEKYLSLHRIGECYENLAVKQVRECPTQRDLIQQTYQLAQQAYLTAFHYRPTRPEALYALTKLHFHEANYAECYYYAKKGLYLTPSSDLLFVDNTGIEYGFKLYIIKTAKQMDRSSFGRILAKELLKPQTSNTIPKHILETIQVELDKL